MIFNGFHEVPVWLKIGKRKVVFAAHEAARSSKHSQKFKQGTNAIMQVGDVQESQRLPPVVAELASKAQAEGMTQRRSGGEGDGADEKFRVTLECRQAVLNFFAGGDQAPKSVQLPPILIIQGVHCRIDNIDKDRRWVKDEEFIVAEVPVIRKKGDKVPGQLMLQWTQLREIHPEYFEQIIVMQQPAATTDEIIVGWSMEDLGQRFPASVMQRDLVSGALSSRAKLAAYLQQVIPCWIGPGMTPVVQVTDTDIAYPLKRKIEQHKLKITKEFKELAIKDGRETSFKMNPPELMKVLYNSIKEFNQEADASQLVLHSLRRNGQLAYIPKDGQFQKLTEEICPWMSKLNIGPMGSHRYPTCWLEDRFTWCSEDGVPEAPAWQDCMSKAEQEAQKEQGQAELSEEAGKIQAAQQYQDFILRRLGQLQAEASSEKFSVDHEVRVCGRTVKTKIFSLEIEEQDGLITPEMLELLQKTPAERRAMVAHSREAQDRKATRKINKKTNRGRGNRFKLATRPFSEDLLAQMQSQLMKRTRAQVFAKLKFETKKKGTKNKVAEKSTKKSVIKKKGASKKFSKMKFAAKALKKIGAAKAKEEIGAAKAKEVSAAEEDIRVAK